MNVRTLRHVKVAALALLIGLVVTSAAVAGRGDPKEQFTAADQVRAKAMLLRPSDFSAAFVARPSGSNDDDFYCSAIDESDLTLTGKAESATFAAQTEYATSTGYVYASRAQSDASWRRGASKAGEQCLRLGVRAQFRQAKARFVSFKQTAFPHRGDRSIAYRAIATTQGVRLYIDVVAIQVGRAQAAVIYGTALVPPPQSELRRLTGVVAARAQKAMQGG